MLLPWYLFYRFQGGGGDGLIFPASCVCVWGESDSLERKGLCPLDRGDRLDHDKIR